MIAAWLHRRLQLSAIVLVVGTPALLGAEAQTNVAAFRRDVLPVLKANCIDCHGPKTQEADLRIDTLDPDLLNGNDAETWHDVMNKLNLGEMPPEEAKPLGEQQRSPLVN